MTRFFSKRLAGLIVCTSLAACGLVLTACVQVPTEKAGVVDLRPQIAFKFNSEASRAAGVLVDGLNLGTAGNYADGVAALRIQPGSHVVTIVLGNQVLLQEKFYIGDGVSRTFLVP